MKRRRPDSIAKPRAAGNEVLVENAGAVGPVNENEPEVVQVIMVYEPEVVTVPPD